MPKNKLQSATFFSPKLSLIHHKIYYPKYIENNKTNPFFFVIEEI